MNEFPVINSVRRYGITIPEHTKHLYISNQELISHGCKNCIWKLHNQCMHGIVSDTEFYEFEDVDSDSRKVVYSGYCPEYVHFLLSFAESGDSISSVWEKFSLYVGRMQALDDYKSYIELKNKIEIDKSNNKLTYSEQQDLEMKKVMLRLWWERLNETIVKGYSRIVNREYRLKEPTRTMPGIMNAKVINFNTVQQIEKKDDNIE